MPLEPPGNPELPPGMPLEPPGIPLLPPGMPLDPPGIPLLIPGERFNRKIVDYLRFTREFNARFPGFDTDVHGLVDDEGEGVRRYCVDCVRVA